ncbi:MAG: ribonuclease P protein component [Bacilli bacterium]|nr:ribonuclease P protein component [Bacilli bacterium]
MKKVNILKDTKDFSRIIHANKSFHFKDYIVYLERTEESTYHFGFSVGKKVGNAVTRNLVKRRLKNILDEKVYQKGFNCIIIVKKAILEKSFGEMREDVLRLVKKIDIIKDVENEK